MPRIYTTPNEQWSIYEQKDLVRESVYSILKRRDLIYYPYALIGNSLKNALLWLRFRNIISNDEYKFALENLSKNTLTDKE